MILSSSSTSSQPSSSSFFFLLSSFHCSFKHKTSLFTLLITVSVQHDYYFVSACGVFFFIVTFRILFCISRSLPSLLFHLHSFFPKTKGHLFLERLCNILMFMLKDFRGIYAFAARKNNSHIRR